MPMPAPTPARAMVARPAPRPLLTMLIHNHHFYTGVQEELGGLFPGVHRVNIEVPTRPRCCEWPPRSELDAASVKVAKDARG